MDLSAKPIFRPHPSHDSKPPRWPVNPTEVEGSELSVKSGTKQQVQSPVLTAAITGHLWLPIDDPARFVAIQTDVRVIRLSFRRGEENQHRVQPGRDMTFP